MDSDFDLFNSSPSVILSRYRSLSVESVSSVSPSTPHKSYHLLPCHGIHQSLCHKAHLVPVEIFSEIFLYTVQVDPRARRNLMLVCRHWHQIMLSTPGIRSQLRIYWTTRKKGVERFGRRWHLDVTVDVQQMTVIDQWGEPAFDPVEFYACFIAAAEAASRWRALTLLSFPPPGIYKDLQITHPLQHLESFKLAASCALGNSMEPLITAIATTVTQCFTVMEVLHPDTAVYLVQPAHFQAFSFLTTLKLHCTRMQEPVDILPSFHKLETLEAQLLSLPVYPSELDLPLTQTLRVLRLKSVSVQWMEGQIFPALKECSVIFPQYADAIRSVYMPSCSILKYDSNNLGAFEHFHIPHLDKLETKCGQWRTWTGTLQLVVLHPILATQSLTNLQLEIKCSERLLAYMLGLTPALEELSMRLCSPNALSSAFFRAFAAGGRKVGAKPPSKTIVPLCRQLKVLHLNYKRWSRGAERNALIPAFGAIVASHSSEDQNFSFQLRFDEGPDSHDWDIHEPVKRFDVDSEHDRTFIGVSGRHGIVPLSRLLMYGRDAPSIPAETEYITVYDSLSIPINYLLCHHSLKEVRMFQSCLESGPNPPLLSNAPLFHTLRVLAVSSAPLSFLSGRTFHKLESYQEKLSDCRDSPGQGPLTEMPVCTRLVAPLSRLATLKLPQISELVVFFDHEEPDYLWGKHVAVNANLSGLRLLALCGGNNEWSPFTDITKFTDIIRILGSFPALQTLVLGSQYLDDPYLNFFKAFIPMNAQGISGLNEADLEGRMSGILCPRLKGLQIEGIVLTTRPELIPVLKDIINTRAAIGSPLKSFTFFHWDSQKKWELIGKEGSFIMKEVVPALEFQLDI